MAETTPVEEMPLGMFIAWLSVFPRRRSVWCCFAGYRCTLGSSVRRICRCIVYRRVCRPVLTSAMASFPCRSASVRPACPLTNVSHHSSAEQDEYAGLWVMPLRLLNAGFPVLEQIPWRFLPSRSLGWSTTTTMVRATRYKEELHMPKMFGTDGVRGLANRDLTARLALDLGDAAVPGSSATPAPKTISLRGAAARSWVVTPVCPAIFWLPPCLRAIAPADSDGSTQASSRPRHRVPDQRAQR